MVPGPMDGNSSPRGRHRHRADPRGPATPDGSPQWSPSASGPQWTPSTPQWTSGPAPEWRSGGPEAGESWFDGPASDRPADPRGQTPPPWSAGADEPPTQTWSWPAAADQPAAPRRPVDEPSTRSWPPPAADRPAPRPRPPAGRAEEQPTQAWSFAAEQSDPRAWRSGADRSGAQSWSAGADEPPARTWAAGGAGQPAWAGPGGPEPVAAGRRGVKHPVRLALYALVIFGLIAGSAAWLSVDKSVRLTVDGEARTVSTYASTVSGVLDDAGVTFTPRDLLAPTAEAKVSDGAEIVLRRGRMLRLTIDGKSRQVWVHATTVQEALDQVGFRQNGLFVSATRSERLPLEGYDLTVRTPKTVAVLADGRRLRVVTTAATVGQALDEAGVTVDGDDKVSQLATAAVVTGMTITVTRVTRKTTTVRTVLQYDTVEKEDPDAEVGSRDVTTKGVPGLQQVTYVETYIDGKLSSKKVAKVTVLKQPVDEVVVVGPEPPPTQPAGCEDFPTTGGLNWCGLARCESGLNPDAYNPAGPYYGLYQFDQGTWQANGGTGTPLGKSIAEQTRVAYNLYQARGRAPWPTCGRYL